jgi:hypothetical protein
MMSLQGRSVRELLRDYEDARRLAAEVDLPAEARERLTAFARFFEREGHRVAVYPAELLPMMLAEPTTTVVHRAAQDQQHARRANRP